MTLSQRGLDLIKKFEGLRLISYKCVAGVDTIGYGHTGSRGGQSLARQLLGCVFMLTVQDCIRREPTRQDSYEGEGGVKATA